MGVKKQFQLENASQAFVSLDIYEEIEEMMWLANEQKVDSKFKYQVLVYRRCSD